MSCLDIGRNQWICYNRLFFERLRQGDKMGRATTFLGLMAFAITALTAANADCPSFHQLQNGQTANANDVMDNFNNILNCPAFRGNLTFLDSGYYVAAGYSGSRLYALEAARSAGVPTFPDLFNMGGNLVIGGTSQGGGTIALNTTGSTTPTVLLTGARVAIGKTVPQQALDVAGSIVASGSITPSDARLKYDVRSLDNSFLDRVTKLRPVTFRWNAPKDDGMRGVQTGLIAQELEKVLPSVVNTAHDRMRTKSIKYTELTVIMLKAIQEQQVLIVSLNREVSTLKKANERFVAQLKQYERNKLAQAQ